MQWISVSVAVIALLGLIGTLIASLVPIEGIQITSTEVSRLELENDPSQWVDTFHPNKTNITNYWENIIK